MHYQSSIRFLIRDGAGQFVTPFDDVFRSDGTTIIRTPPYTPVAKEPGSTPTRPPDVVAYRPRQPIRRHPTRHGLINQYRQQPEQPRHRPTPTRATSGFDGPLPHHTTRRQP